MAQPAVDLAEVEFEDRPGIEGVGFRDVVERRSELASLVLA